MQTKQPKRILVAPLDWGMGHTTRCVPLVRCLQGLGHTPVFAGNAWQRAYITRIFPGIENIHIDGYNVRWDGSMNGFFRQLPGLSKTIAFEHEWLLKNAGVLHLDGILSDNRYGLWHPTIPCVLLTHQLQPLSGAGAAGDLVARKTNYRLLSRFHKVWVADQEQNGLAGRMSHPEKPLTHTQYIGFLSAMAGTGGADEVPGSVLVLLSGPEPQRSILSALLKKQLSDYTGGIRFVEGADVDDRGSLPEHAAYYQRIGPATLTPLLQQADIVICRSGYTGIMDLMALGKRAILIPTPGQTEQLYLARQLQSMGRFIAADQHALDLLRLIQSLSMKQVSPADPRDFEHFKPVLYEWTKGL